MRVRSSPPRSPADSLERATVEIAVVDDAPGLELGARKRAFGHELDDGVDAEARAEPLGHRGAELRLEPGVGVTRRVLGADQELVHRLAARDDDPKLAAEPVDRAQRVLDRARVDILAPDDEHIVDPPVEPVRQSRIRPPARARLVRPAGEVAGDEADHRLRAALEVRVHGRALGAERERRSEEHTSELQSLTNLVCRLLLEKKKKKKKNKTRM